MSHRNYNKMYEKTEVKEPEFVMEKYENKFTPIAVTEEIIEPAIDEEVQMVIEEIIEPAVSEESEPTVLNAVVVNCAKLNVRNEPDPRSEVVAIINASNEVIVYIGESFGNYYKICTASGIEGYCVKDYLELK